MAPRKLVFAKNPQHEDEQQTLDKAYEESNSDSGSEEGGGEGAAPPRKPRFGAASEPAEPEPVENGSACSSPSASGFMILPAAKSSGKKKKTTPASKKFSDEDEIALLKGLAVFWANGKNNKWTEFHHFIKDDLSNQFSKVQVSEKIRALKKKFETNFERAWTNGGRLDFSNSHESMVFELSKALWGDEKGIDQEPRGNAENENENGKAKKMAREMKQVDDHDEKNKKKRKRKQVDDRDEGKKKTRKQKQVEENDDEENISERGKQVDEHDEVNKSMRKGKQVDDHDDANKRKRKEKQVEEIDEKEKMPDQGKQVVERIEESKKPRKQKQVDEHDEKNKISELGKQVDEIHEEDNVLEKGKQVMEISKEEFQSAYPLLYASFDSYGFPKVPKEKCILIPREKAQELEEKWRELTAEACRLELKRIDFIKRDCKNYLQRK